MSFTSEQLYSLLPSVHRVRDAEQGYPLRALVEVLADQVAVLEEDLEDLYDNSFVETAAPWAIPYIGELLGIQGLPSGSLGRSSRAEVAHTIGYRRRKGTAAMLELLARDITGWPARAVEYFERLSATQHLNHTRPHCRSFASLRDIRDDQASNGSQPQPISRAVALEFVGTAFEDLMRNVEVRRIEPGLGRWNIPNVGLSVWRLRAYSCTGIPLTSASFGSSDPLAQRRYRFHPLGVDAPLFSHPLTESEASHLATRENVPWPISRRVLAEKPSFQPSISYYGSDRSLLFEEFIQETVGGRPQSVYRPIPADRIVVCDLSDRPPVGGVVTAWFNENRANADRIAIDPVLGRVVLGPNLAGAPPPRVRAFFYLGFSHDIGGGEYSRSISFEADTPVIASVGATPAEAHVPFTRLTESLQRLGAGPGAIEIAQNSSFAETGTRRIPDLRAEGVEQEIRAADGIAAAFLLAPNRANPWTITGDANGSVTLNGLWISGRVRASGNLGALQIRHCTVRPGLQIGTAIAVVQINASGLQLTIENCILPALQLSGTGVRVHLRNCIVDASSESAPALSGPDLDTPAGTWRIENCTIRGSVNVEVLELASNTIFLGESVRVTRRQQGCVRFSWVPLAARTPRRFQCLPAEDSGGFPRPQFTSVRFGDPGYFQLSAQCAESIRTGADDASEMGAFHDLYQPLREAHLRQRLREYLRFGLEAGIFHET